MLCWTQRKANIWVRDKVGVKNEGGMLCFIGRRKLAKYGDWEIIPDNPVLTNMERKRPGKHRRGRRKRDGLTTSSTDSKPLERLQGNAKSLTEASVVALSLTLYYPLSTVYNRSE